MRMEDGLSATFKLTKVNMVQVEGIRHVDLDGTNTKYVGKLKFGKRKFDLELFETATGKLIWSTYSLFKDGNNYFRKNPEKSDKFKEVYTLQTTAGKTSTTYEVSLTKGFDYRISINYSERTEGVKVVSYVLASGTY